MTIRPQRFATAKCLASACAAAGAAVGFFVATVIAAAGGGVANLRVLTIGFRTPWTALGAGVAFTIAAAWLRRGASSPGGIRHAAGARTRAPLAAPTLAAQGASAGDRYVRLPEQLHLPPGLPAVESPAASSVRAASARQYRRAALAIAVCSGIVAWAYGTESAAGADASGYLNAAKIFAAGATSVAQPLAAEAPWPDALRTMAPLGFRPGGTRTSTLDVADHSQPGRAGDPRLRLVPTYPAGLPLAYAAAMHVHPRAWTLVVPLLAAAGVFGTFVIGARFTSARAALLAACGIATSPVFLFHAVQPMSDVPATAWWMLAIACALHGTPRWSVASGLATGAAILTRPNLAPIALAVFALVLLSSRRASAATAVIHDPAPGGASSGPASFDGHSQPAPWHIALPTGISYLVALLPAVLVAARLNTILYGHPLASGYGSAAELFSLSFVATNLARYTRWLADVHPIATSAALAGAVIFVARRRVARSAGRVDPDPRPAILALAGFVALNIGAYLVYAPFESWTYLRFLLPSFPLVAIAAASAFDRVLVHMPRRAMPTVAAVLCGLVVGLGIRDASARGVFERRTNDARHELIADAYRTEAASRVFVAQQHGGAVLFHTGAPVLRWDLIEPAALDAALAWFAARGLTPVILVDAEEEPVFRARFAGHGAWAGLDWPARVETAPPQRARAYELPDRARFEAGARWSPQLLRRR